MTNDNTKIKPSLKGEINQENKQDSGWDEFDDWNVEEPVLSPHNEKVNLKYYILIVIFLFPNIFAIYNNKAIVIIVIIHIVTYVYLNLISAMLFLPYYVPPFQQEFSTPLLHKLLFERMLLLSILVVG